MAEIWELREKESIEAYAAFCKYRDLGPSRSLNAAYGKSKRASGRWNQWAADHEWSERVRAYDEHLERESRRIKEEEHARSLRATLKRQLQLGRKFNALANSMADLAKKKIDELKASDEPVELSLQEVNQICRTATALAKAGSDAEFGGSAISDLLGAVDESA